MKIYAVCGFGVGSSMILKMSLDKIIKEKGLQEKIQVENTDITNAIGARVDAIFTSPELYENLSKECHGHVYAIKKYMDLEEVRQGLEKFLLDINKK